MSDFDVAIVGSGFAGLSALQLALQQGRKCALVAKDFGATQHFSGAFDWIDPRILRSTLLCEDFSLPQTALDFCAAHPQHYYTQHVPQNLAAMQSLSQTMLEFFRFYQIPHIGDGQTGVWALGSAGFLKPTAFALQGQALTASQWKAAKRVLVLGFKGVPDYAPAAIAQNLKTICAAVDWQEFAAFAVMPASPYVSILRALQDESHFKLWCEVISTHLQSYDLVIVPPVLSAEFAARFFDEFAGRVCEMLSVLPSVSGQRLQASVQKSLTQKSVTRVTGKVVKVVKSSAGTEIQAMQVQTPSGIEACQAQRWILATGKFLGGGIELKNNTFKETILNLPLAIDQTPLLALTHMTRLIQKEASLPQAFLKVGVRPSMPDYPLNLSICGHLLTGFDFTREHCGFGASVISAQNTLPIG